MSDQVPLNTSTEINTAADLARLRDERRTLNTQELKELNARLKALEEMARIEDRFRLLENRKRRTTEDQVDQPGSSNSIGNQYPAPANPPSTLGYYSAIRPSIEPEDSDSSSRTIYRPHKRRRYTKGIKITPSYTLKTSSSFRE
jgi:hypothetical protein